jgi:hypothetical protein
MVKEEEVRQYNASMPFPVLEEGANQTKLKEDHLV